MTKSKAKSSAAGNRPLVVDATKDESQADAMARVMTAPFLRHGILSNAVADKMVGKLPGEPRFDEYAKVIKAKAEVVEKGDLSLAGEPMHRSGVDVGRMFTNLPDARPST